METTIEIIQGVLGFLGFINSIYLIGIIICILKLKSYAEGDVFISFRHEFNELIGGFILIALIYSIIYFTLYFTFI